MAKVKLVVCDVDGLLLDTESIWQKAWQITGENHGMKEVGSSLFLKVVGRNGNDVEAIVEDELSFLEQPFAFIEEARSLGKEMLTKELKTKKGVYELLDALDRMNIRKAIATSTPRDVSEKRLRNVNIWHRFDYILCGDEVTRRKPDPQMYLRVLEKMNTAPQDALVLEDSIVGVESACRAGIPCIMVPDRIQPTTLQKEKCCYIANSLLEIIAFLS